MKTCIRALSVLAVCCWGISCQKQVAGTITETDSGIVGTVSNPNGSAAPDAYVKLFTAGDTSRTPISTVVTNANGRFGFTSLTPGTYNVWADGADSSVAFVDSIVVPESTQVRANATLGKPGSVGGIVALQPGHSPLSVTVQALGTQKYVNVNSDGWFTLRGLAQGDYTIRCVTTISGYTPTYREISVVSNRNDTLADTIFMVYSGIPPVTGIAAVYDPLSGIAAVTWNRMRYAFLYNYHVYRDDPAALTIAKNLIGASSDTVYFDTLFTAPAVDTVIRKYRYRVSIYDKTGTEGPVFDFADISASDPKNLIQIQSPADDSVFQKGAAVTVSWKSLYAAKSFQVHVSTKPDFADTVKFATTSDSSFILPNQVPGVYYYRIRCLSADNRFGYWSGTKRFSVDLFTMLYSGLASTMIGTIDSGFLILGNPVRKTDSRGSVQWTYTPATSFGNEVTCGVQCANGAFVLLGGNDLAGPSPEAVWVSSTGTVLWEQYVPKNGYELSPSSLLALQDNGVVCGLMADSMPISATSLWWPVLCKMGASGNAEWTLSLDTVYSNPMLVRNGDTTFTVFLQKHAYGGPHQWGDTVTMQRYDISGKLLGSKDIPMPNLNQMMSVHLASGAQYIFVGRFFYGMPPYTYRICTIDGDGNAVTLAAMNLDYNAMSPGCCVDSRDNGMYFISSSSTTLNTSMTSVKKFSMSGALVWEHFLWENDAVAVSTGVACVVGSDNYVTGLSYGHGPDGTAADNKVILFRMSPDGVTAP
jgi:hypothetical protein